MYIGIRRRERGRFFFSRRGRHTRCSRDWSSDVCSSDLPYQFDLIEPDARDGLETLEAIRTHRPQVVFLDVEMPGLGGFEVVESVTAAEMPLIVFVTARSEERRVGKECRARWAPPQYERH